MTACRRCGRRSFFAWRFGADGRCTLCRRRPGAPGAVPDAGILLFPLLLLASRAESLDPAGWPRILANLGLYILLVPSLVLLHELSHASVGRLLGFRTQRIRMGLGPAWFRFGRLHVHARPYFGGTWLGTRSGAGIRLRIALMTLAGAALPLLLVVPPALRWGSMDPSFLWTRIAPLEMAAWIALLQACASYLPLPFRGRANDGVLLWRAFTRPEEQLRRAYHENTTAMSLAILDEDWKTGIAAARAALEEDPSHPMAVMLLTREGGDRETVRSLLKNFRLDHPMRDFVPAAANNLAWCLLVLGEEAGEADRLSRFAVESSPEPAEFQGTRGCVLAESGSFEEAHRRLFDACEFHTDAGDRSTVAAALAWVCRRLGRIEESASWASRVTDRSGEPEMIARYERRLRENENPPA